MASEDKGAYREITSGSQVSVERRTEILWGNAN